MKKKNPKLILVFLAALIVVLFLIKYAEGEMISSIDYKIEKSLLNLTLEQSNVKSAINNLNNANMKLQENQTMLNNLKLGDDYYLHDPTYKEVMEFLKSNSCSSEKEMIEKAKIKGIRCAYVMVYVGGISIAEVNGGDTISFGGGMYPLIGFNIVDRGMMYYEVNTEYQVMPVVGQDYTNCVVGDPYLPGINDTITDILEIW